MEGSQALGGQQGQGQQGGEGAAAAADGQGQQGPDINAIAAQLESLTGSQEELRQFLMSNPWQQQAAQGGQQQEAAGPAELDLSFLDIENPTFDPSTVADRLQQVIAQQIDSRVQPVVDKLTGERQEEQRQRDAEILVGEFPEMRETDVAEQVVLLARQMAEALGRPDLANEPKFWRYAYMVGRAADAANTEGAETPGAAHLEGGGGATPAGSQVDLGDLIVGTSRGGSSVLPFH